MKMYREISHLHFRMMLEKGVGACQPLKCSSGGFKTGLSFTQRLSEPDQELSLSLPSPRMAVLLQ